MATMIAAMASNEPALALTRSLFPPLADQPIFGSIGDSAPDTWVRRLMPNASKRTRPARSSR
ncbi:hypothetical protein C0Z20_18740 [Trinickia symbiotica]|uniref:Uncharacterized protein n=1 Tax=Trinickia symbiotica TaxID=863227 RepID=A0A2N7X0Q5_9BURK|nr:hypothetical protein C0Z20_18740 [Trinickia symbiotica]